MKYRTSIVLAYFKECGVPEPEMEFQFAPPRKWRFDFVWNYFHSPIKMGGGGTCTSFSIQSVKVALEVQGGIFIQGRHSRGAALLKEWEKLNCAAVMGYRILFCQPSDLCTLDTVNLIKRALGQPQ